MNSSRVTNSSNVEHGHGGLRVDHGGIYVEKLLELDLRHASIGFAVYEPGAATGVTGVVSEGMEFLMVLEGEVTAEIAETSYRLGVGDYVHFSKTIPHRGLNTGQVTSRALYVNYLPSS